jgi:hypothetical protein
MNPLEQALSKKGGETTKKFSREHIDKLHAERAEFYKKNPVPLNPWRSKNEHSMEHGVKMSAYRKMDKNPGDKSLVKAYEKAVDKASGKKGYKWVTK